MNKEDYKFAINIIESNLVDKLHDIYSILITYHIITKSEHKMLIGLIKEINKQIKLANKYIMLFEENMEYELNEFDIELLEEFISKNLKK